MSVLGSDPEVPVSELLFELPIQEMLYELCWTAKSHRRQVKPRTARPDTAETGRITARPVNRGEG